MANWWPWSTWTRLLQDINTKLEQIMSQQDELNQDVQALTSALNDVATQTAAVVTDVSNIQQEIANLQQQITNGQPVDLSALDALAQSAAGTVSALDTAVASLNAAAPPSGA